MACCSALARLSRSAAKAASARLRRLGLIQAADARLAAGRLAVCQTCPLRRTYAGQSFCGTPLLRNLARVDHLEGCGCPLPDKAADPDEHCPADDHFNKPAAQKSGTPCNCRWCVAERAGQAQAA